MKKRKKGLTLFFIILLAALAVFVLGRLFRNPAPSPYITEAVRLGDIRRTVNATGEINAVQVVSVGAQVSGQIEKLYVTLGQTVRQGDKIADIDSTTQQNDLDTAKARLESLRAQLEAKQVALRIAKIQLDRELLLKKTDSTSRQNLETAENTYATAKSAVADLESQIVQAQIAVNTAETNLGYTKITAPLNGTIVSVPVEQGQTVNAAQTTPTIVQIADLSRMEIKIEIAEGDITKVRPGLDVEYTILSEPGAKFRATLATLDPGPTTLTDATTSSAAQSSGSASSTSAVYYYANAVVDNADGRLRIGMTTQSTIFVANVAQVPVVPSVAIFTRDGRPYVQVLHQPGEKPPAALDVDAARTGAPASGVQTPGPQASGPQAPGFFSRLYARLFGPGPQPWVEERFIETGLSDNMNTQVISGLSVGEVVVTTQTNSAQIPSRMPMGMGGPRR